MELSKQVEVTNYKGEVYTRGTGWVPSPPDPRDYRETNPQVYTMAESLGALTATSLPGIVDLRGACSPIENQGGRGSCTAHAAMSIVEYMERKSYGKYTDGSRRFIYKATRNLLGWTGDTGAYCRTTMAAARLFGVPPEKYWEYNTDEFDIEPTAFVYALAQDFRSMKYFRHDITDTAMACVLSSIKKYLASKIPAMLGFRIYESFNYGNAPGAIPYPEPGETIRGRHAVAVVGYIDDMLITNTRTNKKTKGALIIRNSWGKSWGDKGYGYLPYQYVLDKYAADIWSILEQGWVDTGEFGLR